MTDLGASIGWGLLVGASLVAGALAAAFVPLPERVAATPTAFSGGLLFVISIAIVPHAFAEVSSRVATATVAGLIPDYLLS